MHLALHGLPDFLSCAAPTPKYKARKGLEATKKHELKDFAVSESGVVSGSASCYLDTHCSSPSLIYHLFILTCGPLHNPSLAFSSNHRYGRPRHCIEHQRHSYQWPLLPVALISTSDSTNMSDVPDAVAELVSEFQKKQAEVGPSAVASNLALMVGLSVRHLLGLDNMLYSVLNPSMRTMRNRLSPS